MPDRNGTPVPLNEIVVTCEHVSLIALLIHSKLMSPRTGVSGPLKCHVWLSSTVSPGARYVQLAVYVPYQPWGFPPSNRSAPCPKAGAASLPVADAAAGIGTPIAAVSIKARRRGSDRR